MKRDRFGSGIANGFRFTIPDSRFTNTALALVCGLVLPAIAMACPACKEALFDPSQLTQRLSTAKGYALSIGLLLAVPLALVGGIAALVVLAHHKHTKGPLQ